MAKTMTAEIKEREAQTVYGLWRRSSVNSAVSEWEHLMVLYTSKTGDKGMRFVIRENTDEKMNCDLFCGGQTNAEDLSVCTIPAGTYVSVRVTPKFGLFWGTAIDDADRYLQNEWLSTSGRRLADYRLEIRDMMGKKPYVEILYKLEPEE